MNKDKISLWKLLEKQTIIIPIIQRDYAQGRLGQEYLRRAFLTELEKALDSKDKLQYLTLDFVYGTENHGDMNPLDGQQRLTTLWLLHWYIAFRLDKLDDKSIYSILKQFTYETRTSSKEFCHKLLDLGQISIEGKRTKPDKKGYKRFIQQQMWYYTVWNQDPTIQAMLRMICGTSRKEGDNDIMDGIDELLGDCPEDILQNYWTLLTGNVEDCPITFYQMTIGTEKMPLSDDLYIKMNARGKPLSDFENLKAEIVNWLYLEENKLLFGQNKDLQEKNRATIAALMDNQWTDIFWNDKMLTDNSTDGRIDEIYFAFINRYFLNELITRGLDKNGKLYRPGFLQDGESDNKADDFDYFYGTIYVKDQPKKSSDSLIAFRNFEFYEKVLKECIRKTGEGEICGLLEDFKVIFSQLKKLQEKHKDIGLNAYLDKCIPLAAKSDTKETIDYIPRYKEGEAINFAGRKIRCITETTQQKRVLFFAVCRYLSHTTFDELSFKQWMRVVWNILQDTNPNNSISDFTRQLRLIDELSKDSGQIYYYLKHNYTIEDKKPVILLEEVAKANQILDENDKLRCFEEEGNPFVKGINTPTWEEVIINAEHHAFFKGAIRFLITDANGKIDWNDFTLKCRFANKIFCNEGLSEKYRKDGKANRILLSYCNKWNEQIESYTSHDKHIFSPSASCWLKEILLKNDIGLKGVYSHPLHELLTGQDINTNIRLSDVNEMYNCAFDRIVNTNLLGHIFETDGNRVDKYYIRFIYDGLSLYPSSEGYILTLPKRDRMLGELIDRGIIKLYDDGNFVKLEQYNPKKQNEDVKSKDVIFKGWNITFQYTCW